MRFYILDDLVDPESHAPMRVEGAVIETRPGPPVARCARWCGRLGTDAAAATPAECDDCQNTWVAAGELVGGSRRYAIRDGIPRFVDEAVAVDRATQESFGYEWEHFDQVLEEYDREVHNYFDIVPRARFHDAVVLDAGCGMGRWAHYAAGLPITRLYAIDFSRAIDRAAATLADRPRAHCVQADVTRLPFRDKTIDLTYCLGVLHHLENPDAGMRSLNRVTRASGGILTYLYYALDNRPAFHRALLAGVTTVRRVTSRLPKPAMHALAWVLGVTVYWPLARTAGLLERAGLPGAAHQVPLSHYRKYSLSFMAGDAFDRFATPIEHRYSRAAIAAWLARYGRRAQFSDHTPFWVSLATSDAGRPHP